MNRHRTYRIIMKKSDEHVVDVIACDEAQAVERAEALWYRGDRSRFQPLFQAPQLSFVADEQSCLHLADVQNDDRAEWAEAALRAFSAKTGSGVGDEGLHDLIADLGHYADRQNIDFLDCIARAIGCWAVESRPQPSDERIPPVTIRIGEGGEP